MFDNVAQRYHCRPSALLGITDIQIALDFDISMVRKIDIMMEKETEGKKQKENELARENQRSMIQKAAQLKDQRYG